MNYIIIDLEFNNLQDIASYLPGVNKEDYEGINRKYPNEIIEIGAVKLDKFLKPMDTFKTYVKPAMYQVLNPKITEMTGIKEMDLEGGRSFLEALEMLKEFSGEDAVICSWSKADIVEIIRNSSYHGCKDLDWISEYMDIQEYCTKMLAAPNSLSLKNALSKLCVRSDEGKLHDALNDAVYSAEVFRRLYNFKFVKKYIVKDISRMPAILIDYSQFKLDQNMTDYTCPKCSGEIEVEHPLELHSWRYVGLGCCKKCNHKVLQQVVVKQNLLGENVYKNMNRIISDEEYIMYLDRFKKIS